jgi:hypothetical protein
VVGIAGLGGGDESDDESGGDEEEPVVELRLKKTSNFGMDFGKWR